MFFLSVGEVRQIARNWQPDSVSSDYPFAGIRTAAADYPARPGAASGRRFPLPATLLHRLLECAYTASPVPAAEAFTADFSIRNSLALKCLRVLPGDPRACGWTCGPASRIR
jgi:hypothetical protein